MKISFQAVILFFFISAISCEPEEVEKINTLTVSKNKIEIPAEGGSTTFTLETDAGSWTLDNPATDWISIPITSGSKSEALISLTVDTKTLTPRADTLTISAGNASPVKIIVSQASSEYLYNLSCDRFFINFDFPAGTTQMKISAESAWTIDKDIDWVEFSQTNGVSGESNITINVTTNNEVLKRSGTIFLKGEGAPTIEIPISQKGAYPSYNTNPIDPDMTGMTSTATELASNMVVGWNIGNTLEAMGGETAWGNPQVTEDLIKLVKANGFNAIRIPCSWDQYLEDPSTAKLKVSWLERVKEVVEYCVANDMYVILNIHWDGGWLENNIDAGSIVPVNAKQKAYWEQIATYFRDFDEHLIFAGANEPNVESSPQMNVLNSYHQTFVDAVRSTGGKNSYRVLIVQGPSTDITKTNDWMNRMPTDEVANRMMAEVHYYTPYQFCLMTEDASWGNMFYYWGADYHSTTDTDHNADWGEESTVDNLFASMKTKFVDKGIPVVLGEYAVIRRTNLTGDDLDLHLASRAYYLKYVTSQAKANGLIPFYWDAGNMGENASALFNRSNNTVFDQQALNAIIQGATE